MSRRPRDRVTKTSEELQAAARHVRYEMDMLIFSVGYIPNGLSSPAVPATQKIALESFLLHFRNLRAFLCPTLQLTTIDDVVASDYLDKVLPENIGDATELGLDKARIDRLLAHISYHRPQYEAASEKSWYPEAMVQRIEKGMGEFFRLLPSERRSWFAEPVIVSPWRRLDAPGS